MVISHFGLFLNINFMKKIGIHFDANKMLATDCYKNRLEEGWWENRNQEDLYYKTSIELEVTLDMLQDNTLLIKWLFN